MKAKFLALFLLLSGFWLVRSQFEAPKVSAQKIQFQINKETTLQAIVSDLKYYNFIKNETAFRLALRFTKDETSGNENSIRIGRNSIDRQAFYTISQEMSVWELAKVLLTQGTFQDCSHGCPESRFWPELLPGGELKPSEYEWVETFEDCVKAKGQLSSEQYSQRTGNPRKCVTPDGREFTEGKEGWEVSKGG